jgi:hypothetical protein
MKPGWTMIQLVRSLVSSGIDSRLVDKTAGLLWYGFNRRHFQLLDSFLFLRLSRMKTIPLTFNLSPMVRSYLPL